jgi:hypothetical protein
LPHRSVELPAQQRNGVINVALRFQSRQKLSSVLMITFLQGLGSAFQPGTKLSSVEKFDGLVAQCFVETVAEVTRIGEAVPGLFRHPLMDYATNRLIHFGIEFRRRRRNLIPDGVDNLLFVGPAEGMV